MSTFTSDDGLAIAYQEWGTDRRGDAPPIVLHHGFAVDADLNFVQPKVVAALVAAGRHVVGIDARGHGASDKPHESSFYGEEAMATDVVTLIDVLGAGEIHLVGYSMGAIVSLLTAAREPRVTRLVVGGVGAAVVELGGVDTRAVPNEAIAAALRADDPDAIEHPGAKAFRALADAVGADRLALAAQADVVHRGPIAFDAIAAPTLVLAGDADPLAVRPQVLVDALGDGRLRMLTGDHLGAVGDPTFATAIVEFLAP
jgi:pimeloyl-ACP methyl ester carboxylesterase